MNPTIPDDEEGLIYGEPDRGDPQGGRHGLKVADVCRKYGICQLTLLHLEEQVCAEAKRVKELEAGHSKLKRMYADLAMEN